MTSLVSGNGTYTFALVADSNDGVTFSSREGTAPPQLVVRARQLTDEMLENGIRGSLGVDVCRLPPSACGTGSRSGAGTGA